MPGAAADDFVRTAAVTCTRLDTDGEGNRDNHRLNGLE